jgi:hypothetical protein
MEIKRVIIAGLTQVKLGRRFFMGSPKKPSCMCGLGGGGLFFRIFLKTKAETTKQMKMERPQRFDHVSHEEPWKRGKKHMHIPTNILLHDNIIVRTQ